MGLYQNMLINDRGHLSTKTGQPATSNQFIPTGQYFVLEPENTDA